MDQVGETNGKNAGQGLTRGIVKRARQILLTLLLMGALLFIPAGTLSWPMAWVYLAVYLASVVINAIFLWRKNPELIAERAEKRPDTKKWDSRLTTLATPLFFALFIVSGLDRRFGWTTPLPLAVQLTALVLYLLGSALASWALISNAYFAATVRIQKERGHQVITDGPYRTIRHPGYCGWSIGFLVTPAMLGSLWALIPAVLNTIAFIIRTALEDHTLRAELEGYQEYARRVRYRLVPGIW